MPSGACGNYRVTVDKLVFSPAKINAKVADTIEWVNQDIPAHTATVAGDWDVNIPSGAAARVDLKRPAPSNIIAGTIST